MNKERFSEILNTATVRTSNGKGFEGLLIQGVTQQEMAELITLEGERLEAWNDGRQVSAEYLELGPESNWHMMYHPDFIKTLKTEMTVRYERVPEKSEQWCIRHHCKATHLCIREGGERPDLNPPEPCCDPHLVGIMVPCKCVPLIESKADLTYMKYEFTFQFKNPNLGFLGTLKCVDTASETVIQAESLADLFQLAEQSVKAYERTYEKAQS